MNRLDRFKRAQQSVEAGHDQALAEMRAGRKSSHWIWYIFPQLAGLGTSMPSQTYGIVGIDEAVEYLRDDVLRGRLDVIAAAAVEQLQAGARLTDLMGGRTDALKLVSSLTLFGAVARHLAPGDESGDYARIANVADQALQHAEADGFHRCEYTRGQLDRWLRDHGGDRAR